MSKGKIKKEKAFLVGAVLESDYRINIEEQIVELQALANTAGASTVGYSCQKRKHQDPTTFIGKGKAESVINQANEMKCNLIIFNNFHYETNSAVIEISPPITSDNTNYIIEEDMLYGPLSWEWMYYNPDVLSSQLIQSGAFRLENGNTYITTFANAKMFEVNYNGDIVFEYSSPDISDKINRAKKYPSYYLESNKDSA